MGQTTKTRQRRPQEPKPVDSDGSEAPGHTAPDLVRRRSGVELVSAMATAWGAFSRVILEFNWLTEPGWTELEFDQPAFLTMVEEVGGRADFRSEAGRSYEGDYIGAEHVSLVAGRTPVIVHAFEMRRATIVACVFSPKEGEDADIARSIARSPTRLMVRSRPLHDCARLFATTAAGPEDMFASALARSVLIAWATAVEQAARLGAARALSGDTLREVLAFIRNELDAPIRTAELADLAGLSPAQFGKQFQEATGQTLQAWQMDARVRNVQRLMVDDPQGSLAEYAALCGFADQSHFSRVFLKVVGISPTEWLKRRL
jgi:AraC-like DNA-binding protein